MKVKFALFVAFCMMIQGVTAFSGQILLRGKPVELIVHPGYFTFPTSYTDRNKGYHFITYMNVLRVCYLMKRQDLAELDMVKYNFEDDARHMDWYCYKFDPQYFKTDS